MLSISSHISALLPITLLLTGCTFAPTQSASATSVPTTSIAQPTLSFSAALSRVPVTQGATATDLFKFTGGGSFQGPVTLTVSGLPAGVTASWTSNPVTLTAGTGPSTLSLAANATAVANWFTFTVTASGNGLNVSVNYVVAVAKAHGVQIQVPTWTVGLTSMGTVTVPVTATPINGAAVAAGAPGASARVISGLPSGLTASWSQPTLSATGVVTWALTLTGSPTALASSGTVMVSAQITDATSGTLYAASQGFVVAVTLTPPTLSFSAALSRVPVTQGATATDLFKFTGGGSFQGPVTLTVSGLPAGVTASWTSNPVTLTAGTGPSTLSLAANATAVANWFTFTVTASGNGLNVSVNYVVAVAKAHGVQIQVPTWTVGLTSMGTVTVPVTATPINGAAVAAGAPGASARVISGLPSGLTASWSQPTLSATGVVTWALTLTGSPTALASSGTVMVSAQITDATSGTLYAASQGFVVAVTLTPPTLSFSAALSRVPVIQGATATDLFRFTGGGSFQGPVTLTVSGLPAGVTASWTSNPVTLTAGTGTSTLSLAASTAAVVNWFTFTVTASGNGPSVSANYVVEVEPTIGVYIQLPQSVIGIQANGTASLLVTAQPLNGVTLPVGAVGASMTLASGLPTGVTASWSKPVVTAAGAVNWTMILSADPTVQTGSYTLGLSAQITDKSSGTIFYARQSLGLNVSLLANVSVGSTPGVAISSTFMGLSTEWGDAQRMMGSSGTGVNRIYRQLLTNLTSYGSGPLIIRIGGASSDHSSEPITDVVKPFAELSTALGARFYLGVNLGQDNVNLATDQARAYLSQMPVGSVDAIEIGNEPDLYVQAGFRPTSYTVQDYYTDFDNWKANIQPMLPVGTKLLGASWASVSTLVNISDFETRESGQLTAFSQHLYATSPTVNPPLDFLLHPTSATSGPLALLSAVNTTHTHGIPFRMDEFNSIDDIGIHGISDAFGAGLWAIDTMFEYANEGVDGLNWQTDSGNYDSPIYFASTTSNGLTTYTLSPINPLYYGLLFFQAATGNKASILPLNLTTQANLKAWATIDASGTPRLSIINKDETLSGTIAVTLPGYSHASVRRLTAPSYQSTEGVTFAGQTFDGSTDGNLQGTQTIETIDGINGAFQLPMSVTSAALVTFSH